MNTENSSSGTDKKAYALQFRRIRQKTLSTTGGGPTGPLLPADGPRIGRVGRQRDLSFSASAAALSRASAGVTLSNIALPSCVFSSSEIFGHCLSAMS